MQQGQDKLLIIQEPIEQGDVTTKISFCTVMPPFHGLEFLAPLAEGQQAIVFALCLLCVRQGVCP